MWRQSLLQSRGIAFLIGRSRRLRVWHLTNRVQLARLHLDYEKLEPYPLKWIEAEGVPLSYNVEDKMRLTKDKTALRVNPSLTLGGIPPETFHYRLGNRSALDWVIDQYQVYEDERSGIRSDPNRAD